MYADLSLSHFEAPTDRRRISLQVSLRSSLFRALSLFLSLFPHPTSTFVSRCLQSSSWLDQRSRIELVPAAPREPDEREKDEPRAIGRTELSRRVFPKRSAQRASPRRLIKNNFSYLPQHFHSYASLYLTRPLRLALTPAIRAHVITPCQACIFRSNLQKEFIRDSDERALTS